MSKEFFHGSLSPTWRVEEAHWKPESFEFTIRSDDDTDISRGIIQKEGMELHTDIKKSNELETPSPMKDVLDLWERIVQLLVDFVEFPKVAD